MVSNRSDQLRYRCQKCGNCCRWEGYVRLNHEEMRPIAHYLGLSVDEFVQKYTILTRDRRGLSLTENEDGACVFLSPDGCCMIQPVKPEQCRQFPNFWVVPGFRDKCRAIDTWVEEGEHVGNRCPEPVGG